MVLPPLHLRHLQLPTPALDHRQSALAQVLPRRPEARLRKPRRTPARRPGEMAATPRAAQGDRGRVSLCAGRAAYRRVASGTAGHAGAVLGGEAGRLGHEDAAWGYDGWGGRRGCWSVLVGGVVPWKVGADSDSTTRTTNSSRGYRCALFNKRHVGLWKPADDSARPAQTSPRNNRLK